VPIALRLLLVAGPAALAAAVGTLHPVFLTPDTADRWQLAHYLLLPVFPLIALSVWVLLRRESGPVAWAARVLALGFALGYTALDSIAGLGAPEQVRGAAQRGDADPPVTDLFAVGDPLGHLGVLALAVSAALTAALLLRRSQSLLAPLGGALAVAGCWFVYRHHVFPPRGVLGMLAVAAGLALLGVVQHQDRAGVPAAQRD
jgi:hypothetical protein